MNDPVLVVSIIVTQLAQLIAIWFLWKSIRAVQRRTRELNQQDVLILSAITENTRLFRLSQDIQDARIRQAEGSIRG